MIYEKIKMMPIKQLNNNCLNTKNNQFSVLFILDKWKLI